MNRIKVLALSLFLGLTGAVYAAGQNGKLAQTQSCPMKMGSSSAVDASCCDACSCCTHKAGSQSTQTANSDSKSEECCLEDMSGCGSGAPSCPCCPTSKSGDGQAKEQARVTHEDGADCCMAGASCCDGGSCCTASKKKT